MVEEDPGGGRREVDFAEALRRAVAERKVTLAWLHERLAASGNSVSIATLSYWRSGARRPEGAQSMAAVAEIEALLRLEEGALASLIGPSLRVGPVGSPQYPFGHAEVELAATETFAALGAPLPECTRDVSVHVVTDVGADGFVISRTTRALIQATTAAVTEMPCLELSPGVPARAPLFRADAGAEVLRHYSHPSGEVHGVVLGLERPLTMAQTAMVEWTVEFAPGSPASRETGYAVSRRSREVLLWTRFHPDALPQWCEEVVETPAGTVRTPLPRDGGRSVHQVHRRFGPGLLALRWGYEDDRG